jgi:hypothetical protein
VTQEQNLFLCTKLVPTSRIRDCSGGYRTSLRACRSSGVNSGSLGGAASFFGFSASASLAGLVDLALALEALEVDSLAGMGDSAPLADLGVALLVSFILGFLTESERCGVCLS